MSRAAPHCLICGSTDHNRLKCASSVVVESAQVVIGGACHKCGNKRRYARNLMCIHCAREKSKRAKSTHEGRAISRESYQKKTYNISKAALDAILLAQGGGCAICKSPEPVSVKGWCIDHDHATGLVRGVLCVRCNWGLGHFKDSASSLRNAAEYLEQADVRDARIFFAREFDWLLSVSNGTPIKDGDSR